MHERLSRIVDRARRAPEPEPASPPPASKGFGLRIFDPGAIADAMIARRRVDGATTRARIERAALMGWDAEMRAGETLAAAMSRVIAEGLPAPIEITWEPSTMRLRDEFAELSESDRQDEIDRHLWSRAEPGRVRTRFAALFDATGVAA